MHALTEVRRAKPVEAPDDSSRYAASAGAHGAGHFLTILNEVARQDAPPEAPASEPGTEAAPTGESNPTSEVETPDSATPADETDGTTDAAQPGESTVTTSETPPGGAVTGAGEPVVSTEPPPPPAPAPGATAPAATPAATPQVAAVSVAVEASGAGTAAPVAETPTTPPPVIAEVTSGSDVAVEVIAASVDGTAEPAPTPAPTFPKSLNAWLAEESLRQQDDPAAQVDGPLTEALEQAAPVPEIETGGAPRLEDTPLPQAPRAIAMESAGVRPEAPSAVRLPMANLPGNLAQQISVMQQEGARTMRLRLVPEHLGELQIEIQGVGDSLRVRLTSATPAVREALEQQMGDLKDALQKQGIALDQATVDGDSARRQDPREHTAPRPPAPERAAPATTTPSAPPETAGASGVSGTSALNLLV